MNLILIDAAEVDTDRTVILDGRRAEHIRKVLRGAAGDTLRIGLLNGPLGQGTIRSIDGRRVVLEVAATTPPPQKRPVALILALPRPIMLKRVLAQATSLGVGRIFLINANRVEKSFFGATLLEEARLTEPLLLGLEQAVDTRLPELSVHHRFRPFVEDVLPAMAAEYPVRLVAHPDTDLDLSQAVRRPLTSRVLLAIGPEGGWVDFEIDKFREQGFTPFTLGPRILRVDTAVPALLAQIDLLCHLPH